MKKEIAIFTLFIGVTSHALAANYPDDGIVTTEACSLLGEQVTLNTSRFVHGAYTCIEEESEIKVAACHEAGSRKPLEVQCTQVGDSNPPVFAPTGCTSANGSVTISNFRGYTGSSRGGSIVAEDLGSACSDSAIDALVN